MDATIGDRTYAAPQQAFIAGPQERSSEIGEVTAREIDMAVRRLVEEAAVAAKAVLDRREDDLHAGAKLLLQKETLTVEEFPPLRQAGEVAATAAPVQAPAAA